jgi:hypothetical protein
MESQQQRVLVALGATTGAVAACVLAHKLWLRHVDGESMQVGFSCTDNEPALQDQQQLLRVNSTCRILAAV